MKTLIFLSLILIEIFNIQQSFANVGEAYGLGSRAGALMAAGASTPMGAMSAYYNPAALSLPTGKRFQFSFGLLLMEPEFKSISNVVVENNYTSDKVPARYGNVDTSYRSTFGQAMALSYQFEEWRHLSLGLSTFLPLNQTAYLDTGEAFIPEYVMYRSRTQRPQIDYGMGIETLENLFFGAGLHIGFSITSNASLFIQTQSDKPSTMRFIASMKPKAGPFFSLLYTTPPQASGRRIFTGGLVFRFPLKSEYDGTFSSGARVLGNLGALDFNFAGVSALNYDPLTIEIGVTTAYLETARLITQVDYQEWSKFESPAIYIQQPTTSKCEGSGCGVTISPGKNPLFTFKNIWIPRIAHEYDLNDHTTLRVGYGYRPGILEAPTGAGNFLDPPKHMFSAGAGLKFQHFLGFNCPYELDLHASYHLLVTQSITKTPTNEKGDPADSKIGSPGYEAGGKVYGGGASLSFAF